VPQPHRSPQHQYDQLSQHHRSPQQQHDQLSQYHRSPPPPVAAGRPQQLLEVPIGLDVCGRTDVDRAVPQSCHQNSSNRRGWQYYHRENSSEPERGRQEMLFLFYDYEEYLNL
jgi:hypothetical protein